MTAKKNDQILILINKDLKEQFRQLCAEQHITMSAAITRWIYESVTPQE